MKQGDWLKIGFLGKVKATGEVFDLTSEADAKKHDIHDEKKRYGPVLVIIGGEMIIPGVEKHLLEMKVGDQREFDVPPKEALGPRIRTLIKILSYPKFVKQNINPVPGVWVNVDGSNCKIMSVSGGRVMVDFNHPLAGKDLHYRVNIVELIKAPLKMVEELLGYYGLEGKPTIAAKTKTVGIKLEKDANPFVKRLVEETLKKWAPGIDKVEFSVKAGKNEEKAEAKTAEAKSSAKKQV